MLLAGLSFAIHLALALHLDATGSLNQYDVFFHADTKARLDCMVRESCDRRASISHPALDLLVNPPVRSAAKVATTLGGWNGDIKAARTAVALWLSPLASGATAAFAFLLFLGLGLPQVYALLATTLVGVSLSGLVFGSIPESFALSGACIAAAFALAAHTKPGARNDHALWLGLSIVATAITVTNIATILILFAASRWLATDEPQVIARRTAVLFATSAALVAVLGFASYSLYDSRPLNTEEGARYISKWTEGNVPFDRALWMATAASNSITAKPPELVNNYQADKNNSRYKFRFTYDRTPSVFSTSRPLGSLLLALALAGAIAMWAGTPTQRTIMLAALAILIFNKWLHAFWGVGHFLYSQHWNLAFSVLVVGPLFATGRALRVGQAIVFATVVAVALQNGAVVRLLLAHFTISPS